MTASLGPLVCCQGALSSPLHDRSFPDPRSQHITRFLYIIPTLLHRRVLLDLDPFYTSTASPRPCGREWKTCVCGTTHRRIPSALHYEYSDSEFFRVIVNLMSDQPLPFGVVSADMDGLTHFPAFDVDGVFLVDTRAIIVYIPCSDYTRL